MQPRQLISVAACFLSAVYTTNSQFQLEQAFPALTFRNPVDLQHPGDGTNRLFVVEQAGQISVFENSPTVTASKLFLDIRDRVNDNFVEEGLLGLAFHPDYEVNGYFYVNYTASNPPRTVIARYRVSSAFPDSADKNSESIVLEFSQPFSNHNGGQISFGPDGYLYIATGDGGSAGDPQDNGQTRTTLLGKVLRIDVDNPSADLNYGIPADNPFIGNVSGYREEIYAYGLRNPWRFSFDPVTGWLWVADVGEQEIEEIDIVEKGKNYGWRVMEGTTCFDPTTGCDTSGLVLPIWEYTHILGQSITGGFVYRGERVPELVGAYIYADFISGRIWALRYDGVSPADNLELLNTTHNIASFGVDENDELFLCAFDGKIYRFRSTATTSVQYESFGTETFRISQNFPNPFNPATIIEYGIPQPTTVVISIYSLSGELVRTTQVHHIDPGTYRFRWDATNDSGTLASSGIYIYQVNTEKRFLAKKMLLLR